METRINRQGTQGTKEKQLGSDLEARLIDKMSKQRKKKFLSQVLVNIITVTPRMLVAVTHYYKLG